MRASRERGSARRAATAGSSGASAVAGRRSALLLAASAGAGGALAARALCSRALLLKLRHDVHALNAGDIQPVLAGYAEDAVLSFNEGGHRWAGEHRGRAAIAAFLQSFVDAGLQGQVTELFIAGPPWRMTLLARFDDRAHDGDGAEVYRNRTVLLARTRRGRIVLHEDFYEDTARIETFDRWLTEREARRSAC